MGSSRFAIVTRRFPLELPTPPGEDYLAAPAEMMAEAGFDVEVLSLRSEQQLPLEQVGKLRVRRYDSPLMLLAAIANGHYTLIHAHSHFLPALLSGLVAWQARTVFTSHSAELPTAVWKRRVLVWLMNRFDRIIALTPYEQRVYTVAGVNPSKIVVIGHGINVAFFGQPGDAARFRQRWGLRPEAIVLLFVANVRQFKNPDVVLRAFRRVRNQEPRALLVIAGRDLLPQQGHPSLLSLVHQSGLANEVILTGWLPPEDLRDAYTAAEIVLNSSATTQESFSISTWEAIAAGRPVCLPRLGTFLSTIGDTALYHEPFDDATLAENVLRYLREPDLRAAHVAANRLRVQQFDIPVVSQRFRTLYQSLLED